MPRHNAQYKEEIIPHMDLIRDSTQEVTSFLMEEGVTQKSIAELSGWTPAYLSQFITNSDPRNPKRPKLENLLTTLASLRYAAASGESNDGPVNKEDWQKVLEVCGIDTPFLSPLGSERIAGDAANYVPDDKARGAVMSRGMYGRSLLVTGPPMSGRSQVSRTYADMLHEHLNTDRPLLDVDEAIVLPGFLERSKTGLLGALATVMCESEDFLELERPEVLAAIKANLAQKVGSLVLLHDEIPCIHNAAKELRYFQRRYLDHEKDMILPVLAETSQPIREFQRENIDGILMDEGIETRWFSHDEVNDLIEKTALLIIRPFKIPSHSGAYDHFPETKEALKKHVWDEFRGQPALTQAYLHGIYMGADIRDELSQAEIRNHTSRLAIAFMNHTYLAGDEINRAIAAIGGELHAQDQLDQFIIQQGVEFGIFTISEAQDTGKKIYTWSCDFYERHLPDAIERELMQRNRR